MVAATISARLPDPVLQFSVFTANRLGRLHDLVNLLGSQSVHVLALTVLDTSDCAIIRLVVDNPDRTRELLLEHGFSFLERELLAVQLDLMHGLGQMMSALLEAELNISYMYSFIPLSQNKSVIALSLEDNEMAEQTLRRHGFQILRQGEISR